MIRMKEEEEEVEEEEQEDVEEEVEREIRGEGIENLKNFFKKVPYLDYSPTGNFKVGYLEGKVLQ